MDTVLSINLITSNPKVRSGALYRWNRIASHRRSYCVRIPFAEHKADLDQDVREQIVTAKALKEQHLANGGRSILP